MKPIYIAWHTQDEPYITYAKRLEKQFKWFGLAYDIKNFARKGKKWNEICQLRPEYFYTLSKTKYKNRPMVYLDVDSDIVQYPILFDELVQKNEVDFACCFCESYKFIKRNHKEIETPAAILYSANNINAQGILKDWMSLTKKMPNQKALKIVLTDAEKNGCNIYKLPYQYFTVKETMSDKIKNVVIYQELASRKLQKKYPHLYKPHNKM